MTLPLSEIELETQLITKVMLYRLLWQFSLVLHYTLALASIVISFLYYHLSLFITILWHFITILLTLLTYYQFLYDIILIIKIYINYSNILSTIYYVF